jgi:hypothetical protein
VIAKKRLPSNSIQQINQCLIKSGAGFDAFMSVNNLQNFQQNFFLREIVRVNYYRVSRRSQPAHASASVFFVAFVLLL